MKMRMLAVLTGLSLIASGCALTGTASGNEVVAYMEDAGDLVVGGNVQMLDVEIGSINEISYVLDDGQMVAKVTLVVDPDVEVPTRDLRLVVRQTSLLGEQFVELVPEAEGPPYLDGDGITIGLEDTERRVDVETFLADLSAFVGSGSIEDLNRFTHAQAIILENRGERLGLALEELEHFTGVLADRKLDISAAIDSLGSAGGTLARNTATMDSFLDSLEQANVLLADQGDELRLLFSSLRRFGTVSARFLAEHEDAIDRQFRALKPVLRAIAGADDELRADIAQLAVFLDLFPKSLGGGPGGNGAGDYVQVEAVICEALENCHTKGEKGDVPGQGEGR